MQPPAALSTSKAPTIPHILVPDLTDRLRIPACFDACPRFPRPPKAKQALSYIGSFVELAELAMLAPTERHFRVLEMVAEELGRPAGNLFQIYTATLMREYGVREIVTADTDFLQFGFLTVTNPLR